MNEELKEVLERFHTVLVREIQASKSEYLSGPFSVAEIYQNLVPYRTHRDRIGVEMNADYEHALLLLLAGEGDFLTIESRTARQEIREELDSPNPNTGLYRDFAAADVRLNPEKVDDALRGWDGPAVSLVQDGVEDEVGGGLDDGGDDPTPEMPDTTSASDGIEEEGPAEEETAAEDLEAEESAEPEVASPSLPFELSGQEELPPEPDLPVQEEDFVEEEPAPTASGAQTPETCPWCREKLPDRDGVKFCPFCGSNVLLVPCPECGEELESNWRFCVTCGTEVSS